MFPESWKLHILVFLLTVGHPRVIFGLFLSIFVIMLMRSVLLMLFKILD